MATTIRNLVPYETKLNARDLASGKLVSNTVYHASDPSGGTYGDPIVGSSNATFLAAVVAEWTTFLLPYLSVNYEMVGGVTRSIIGRKWPGPFLSIAGIAETLTNTVIVTPSPHGLVSGDTVQITGVTAPLAANGTWTPITVINLNEFSIPVVIAPVAYTGAGVAQKVSGQQDFLYGEKEELADATTGSITGDALPLFASVSMRRLNTGIGKNWRSHLSISPIGESQGLNGRLTTTALTNFTTAGSALGTGTLGNGSAVEMRPIVVSKTLALLQATPFTLATAWTKPAITFSPRPNLGSVVQRKPKLTTPII